MGEQGFPGGDLERVGELSRGLVREVERLTKSLEDLAVKLDRVRIEDLAALRVELATLKVKASIWGGLSGILGGGLAWLLSRVS